MGLEIRPAAVINQIEEKHRMLNALYEEIGSRQESASKFASDPFLQGAGFDAARERVAGHAIIFAAIKVSIDRTIQIDTQVSGSLSSYFGGCAEVSEDRWLAELSEADRYYNNLETSLDRYRRTAVIPDQSHVLSMQMAMGAAQKQRDFAKSMLAKIHAYNNETSGLYEGGLADLNASITKGCDAFSLAGFNGAAGRWKPLDTSWFDGMKSNAVKVIDAYFLEESRRDPEKVFLSPDMQHVYCNGEKWRIEGGSSPSLMTTPEGEGPFITQGWAEESRIEFDYEHFDAWLAGVFGIIGFFQGEINAKPKQSDQGVPLAYKKAVTNGMTIWNSMLSSADAVGGAMDRGKVTFVFSRAGVHDQKVAIYASGSLTTYARTVDHLETVWGYYNTPDYNYLDNNIALALAGGRKGLSAFYTSVTGNRPYGDVCIAASFDDAARTQEGFTAQYHFTEEGKLVECVAIHTYDKVTLTDTGRPGSVDATAEWFGLEHTPNGTIEEKVNDELG